MRMKINKFLPFAFIYFFLNTLGLPFGLTWMVVLAPLLYIWVIKERRKEIVLPFLAILFPFIFLHVVVVGVVLKTYLISLLYLLLVYIVVQAFYSFFKVCKDPERIFRKILVINFVFCLIGIIFYFTPFDHWFWIQQEFTKGVRDFRRFKLFTYEASYYATLFIPVFFFYLLQYVFRQNTIKSYWLLPMLFLPLILSFSIGVIAASILAGIITTVFHYRQLLVKRRVVNMAIYITVLTGATMVILVLYFRENPLFIRMLNIFSGKDSSAMGRTSDAFELAKMMLAEKNEWWGIGLGQVKIIGEDIVRGFYLYNDEFVAAIPNVTAETLAVFGWMGLALRLALEIGLFFYTRVWTNHYRLLLFSFLFIYQFTGSFITNLAEYMIWVLAFTNVFCQFDVKYAKKDPALSPSPLHTDQ